MAKKVLIVDDNDAIRRLLAETLEERGYQTFSACDGDEGLAKFHVERPDVVITDLNMPGMNGYELSRRVRKESSVPIVMITGYGIKAVGKAEVCYRGVDAFLRKPFDTEELLDQVSTLLAKTRSNEGARPMKK